MPGKFEEMRERHRKSVSEIFSILLALYLLYFFEPNLAEIWDAFQKGSQGWDTAGFVGNLILSFFPLAIPAVGHFTGLFVYLFDDVYYWLDEHLVGLRAQIHIFIASELFSAAEIPLPVYDVADGENIHAYMSVFYRFVDDDKIVNPELVDLVFSRWGDYYSYLSAGSIATALVFVQGLTILLASGHDVWLGLGILALFVLVAAVSWQRVRSRSRKKSEVFRLSRDEIGQIKARAKDELARAIRSEVLPVLQARSKADSAGSVTPATAK